MKGEEGGIPTYYVQKQNRLNYKITSRDILANCSGCPDISVDVDCAVPYELHFCSWGDPKVILCKQCEVVLLVSLNSSMKYL